MRWVSGLDLALGALLIVALGWPLVVVGYVTFMWVTYIDETVTTGEGYGFVIGASKPEAIDDVRALRRRHPEVAIEVTFGPRAGDSFTIGPPDGDSSRLEAHDRWQVLLEGPEEFHDVVRLTFDNGRLVKIYRHRQYFEVP